MSSEARTPDPHTSLRIVREIEEQAEKTDDPRLKRVLLAWSSEIVDEVLKRHRPPHAA